MDDKTCRHATWTERRWCNCQALSCVEVECRNPVRLAAILPNGEGRTDGANFHCKYPVEYADKREEAPFVLVRSRYCCRQHCVDYAE